MPPDHTVYTSRYVAGQRAVDHLVDRTFQVGGVRMRGTRLCEPCQYLEELTARPRLMSGLLHRGGLRAQILTEGLIRVGDVIRPI